MLIHAKVGSSASDMSAWRGRVSILNVDATHPAGRDKITNLPDGLGAAVTLRTSPSYVSPLTLYDAGRLRQAFDLGAAGGATAWINQLRHLGLLKLDVPLYHLVRQPV